MADAAAAHRRRGPIVLPLAFLLSLPVGAPPLHGATSGGADHAYCRDADGAVCLGNEQLELRLSPQHGGVVSVIHRKSGLDLRQEKRDAYGTIWGLGLLSKTGESSYTDNSRCGRSFRRNSTRTKNAVQLELTWSDLQLDNGQDYPATVLVTITLPDDSATSLWTMDVRNRGRHAPVSLSFPLIAGIRELGADGADDRLVYPSRQGRLYHDPGRNLPSLWGAYPSSFLDMQFVGYYEPAGGFYLACQDGQGTVKEFSWFRPTPAWACLTFRHQPPEPEFGGGFRLPYAVAVGVFDGDWYAAARLYRRWASTQTWAQKSLRERDTPEWLYDTGVSSCFVAADRAAQKPVFASYADITGYAKSHRRYFGTPLLVQLWGWENKGAWSWGDYFPPFEGWSSFDGLVKDLHDDGSRLKAFVGATSVRKATDYWASKEPLPYAARDLSGQLRDDGREIVMCIGTPYWQARLEDTALTLVRHGVDVIQMDSFAPIPTLHACYDKSHGHPPGAAWMPAAWRQTLGRIRARAREINPEVCFTCEGIAEAYIPWFDLAKTWRDAFGEIQSGLWEKELWDGRCEIIPLFNYVYHEQAAAMGEYLLGFLPGRHDEYNRLCLGRVLVWGETPLNNNWMVVESPGYDKGAAEMLKRIAEARTSYAKDFLLHGRMQRPPSITVPDTSVPLPNVGEPRPVLRVPSVLHSAWAAADGSVAVALANIGPEPVAFTVPLAPSRLGLRPATRHAVYAVRDGQFRTALADLSAPADLRLSMRSGEILLLIACPSGGARAGLAEARARQDRAGNVPAGE